jgi:cell division protein FtsB
VQPRHSKELKKMKPVNINLVVKKNIWTKVFLGFVAVFVFTTCGFTMVNTYDYYANTKVIKTYEARLKTINKRSEQKRVKNRKIVHNTKDDETSRQDLDYLKEILKKNMFPLSLLLTQIEKVKPDKVDINELVFSDDLKTVVMKGESNHVAQVSRFLVEIDRSKYFEIELSKEEINKDNRIIFELEAKWISLEK